LKGRGPRKAYVELTKSSPWLYEAATGTCYSKAPLNRTKLIDIPRRVLDLGPDKFLLDDKLAKRASATRAPALAAASASATATPEKKTRATHDFTRTAMVAGTFGGTGATARRLWRPARTDAVWLHVEDVPKAIEHLRLKASMKGVEAVGGEAVEDLSHELDWSGDGGIGVTSRGKAK